MLFILHHHSPITPHESRQELLHHRNNLFRQPPGSRHRREFPVDVLGVPLLPHPRLLCALPSFSGLSVLSLFPFFRRLSATATTRFSDYAHIRRRACDHADILEDSCVVNGFCTCPAQSPRQALPDISIDSPHLLNCWFPPRPHESVA